MNTIEIDGKIVTCGVSEALDIIGEYDWQTAAYFDKLVNTNIDQSDAFCDAERRFNKKGTAFAYKSTQIFGQLEKIIDQLISEYMCEHNLGEYISEDEFITRYGEDYYFSRRES
jgi:hypothetical protein